MEPVVPSAATISSNSNIASDGGGCCPLLPCSAIVMMPSVDALGFMTGAQVRTLEGED
jgi:hypothetical protein